MPETRREDHDIDVRTRLGQIRRAAWPVPFAAIDGEGPSAVEFSSEPQSVCAFARTLDRAGQWSAPSPESCALVNIGCTSAQGSLPIFATLLLGLGAAFLMRRRA